jgi:hypothetical protein
MKSGARFFKPWFVRRKDGDCQVLFPLTELDGIVAIIEAEAYREGWLACREKAAYELTKETGDWKPRLLSAWASDRIRALDPPSGEGES